ncbi:MAG: hypothetical protein LBG74_05550 [Spirochaetaceae bacterium]|nr:hypothetical protein [Spirochaetaceae bacterium]
MKTMPPQKVLESRLLEQSALEAGFIKAKAAALNPADAALFEGPARSIMLCALPYGNLQADEPLPEDNGEAVYAEIAPFARFNYYREAARRLLKLACGLRAEGLYAKKDFRIFCNSRLNEKYLAEHYGLGRRARNGLILIPEAGSLFVIAGMSLPFEIQREPEEADVDAGQFPLCANCMGKGRGKPPCVRACPCGALEGDGRVTLEKCIQWYASGNGAAVPPLVRNNWGKRLYGCGACQDACIYNQRPLNGCITTLGALPRFMDARKLCGMSDGALRAFFKGSAMGMSWLTPQTIRRSARLCAPP